MFASLYAQFSLHFFEQGHVMRNGYGHISFFGLLLNESPFDAEIVVGQQTILAKAWFGKLHGPNGVLFRRMPLCHENL